MGSVYWCATLLFSLFILQEEDQPPIFLSLAGLTFGSFWYNQFMLKDKDQNKRVVRLHGMKEVCELWGISRWRVYDLVKEGKIRPIVNMGKGWKFDGTEFSDDLLERL